MNNKDRAKYCKTCTETHKKKPPCETCDWKAPEILEGNWDAWELWNAVNTQWRATGGNLIGLDYGAVFEVARVMEIEVTKDLLNKLHSLEMVSIKGNKNAGAKQGK